MEEERLRRGFGGFRVILAPEEASLVTCVRVCAWVSGVGEWSG